MESDAFVIDQILAHKILKKLLNYKLYKCCFSLQQSMYLIIYNQNLETTNPSLYLPLSHPTLAIYLFSIVIQYKRDQQLPYYFWKGKFL